MAASASAKRPLPLQVNGTANDGEDDFVRKKVKLSDLPITAAKRKDIDALLHTFKKKGEFDKLRKQIYAEFIASVRSCIATQTCPLLINCRMRKIPCWNPLTNLPTPKSN